MGDRKFDLSESVRKGSKRGIDFIGISITKTSYGELISQFWTKDLR